MAAGRQIQRRAHGGDGGDHLARRFARFAGPAQQRVAAQRDAHGQQPAAPARLLRPRKVAQHPVDFGVVARVVGTRCSVDFARATAKVRHRQGQPLFARPTGKGLGVVAAR
jgi:hypothetical protein